jgi:hypothetical protein
MPRGGRRLGCGRKKGVPNVAKSIIPIGLKREIVRLADEMGVSPLRIMLRFAGDEELPVSLRLAAAAAAAPYVHHRLATLPAPLAPQFGSDGLVIEGKADPVGITTIHIHAVESGHYLDDRAPVRDLEPAIDADVPVPGPAE